MIYRCEECGDDFLTEADSYVVKQTHSGVNLYCSCQIKNKENAMSDWITDRRPIEHDESYVYDSFGHVCHRIKIANGQPWKPIPNCEPYVKPRRWRVSSAEFGDYVIYDAKFRVYIAPPLPTREAAERIAAIYEEVMP